MSFFDALQTAVQIDDENTITLRTLSWGEEQAIKQQSMRVSANQDGQGEAVVDPVKIEKMTYHKAIVAWNGPGFVDEQTGETKPVTAENIDALPSWIIAMLAAPYNELSKMSDAKKKK